MTALTTYTLQIIALEDESNYDVATGRAHRSDQRVLANLPAMVESIEEDFTDLLPEGYKAVIREWQEEAVTE